MENNKKETWNICPATYKTNFHCYLVSTGLWRDERRRLGVAQFGKTIFIAEPKDIKNCCPTFGDQRNFFTGLFEAEYRNDLFKFRDGAQRNPQRMKKIDMFMKILDEIKIAASEQDKQKRLDFYFTNAKNE